jgi:hypothetical protein
VLLSFEAGRDRLTAFPNWWCRERKPGCPLEKPLSGGKRDASSPIENDINDPAIGTRDKGLLTFFCLVAARLQRKKGHIRRAII